MNNIPIIVTDSMSRQDNLITKSSNKIDYASITNNIYTNLEGLNDSVIKQYVLSQNKSFHDNLTWYKKYNPFGNATDPSFQNSLKFKTQTMSMGLSLAANAVSSIIQLGVIDKMFHSWRFKKIFKSLAINTVYIQDKALTPAQILKFSRIARDSGVNLTEGEITEMIDFALQKNSYDLTEIEHSSFNNDDFRAHYFSLLLKLIDLDDINDLESNIGRRLFDYGTKYLIFTEEEYNTLIADTIIKTGMVNTIRDLTQFSIQEVLMNMNNIHVNSEHINSLIDNDPYAIRRKSYQENSKKVGKIFAGEAIKVLSQGSIGGSMLMVGAGNVLGSIFSENNPAKQKAILGAYQEEISYQKKNLTKQESVLKS